MTIASEISKLSSNLADSYTAVSTKGGTLPEYENFDNLPTAIESIPTGGGTTYPGLTTSYANGLATIKKGALADYSISNVTETGCIAKYQNIYNNYKIWGYPTINFGSGVVSGFSGGSTDHYIILPQDFPSTITQADMIFKGMLTDFSYHSMLLARANSYERSFCIRYTTQAFSCYTGSWVDGTNALSTNTWYWFRVIFDGTNWIGYTLEDDDYVLDKLPDISQWRQEWTTTTNIISGLLFNIGFNYAAPTQYWKGSINLGQSQIIINRELWWSAKGNSGIVKRPVYTNFTIVGSPTVGTYTGLVSGLSTSNYLTLPSTIPYNVPVDIYCKFKLTSSPNATACIVELSNDWWQGFNIAVTNNSKLRLWTSSGDAYGSTTLSLNTNYWVKCISTSSGSSLYLSTDGETYTLETTLTSNMFSSWYLSSVYIGVRGRNKTEAFTFGEVDLLGCYINTDGTIWWNPAISSYLQTQGMLDTLSGTIPSSATSLYINYNPVGRSYMLDTLNSMKAVQVGNKWYSCPSGGQVNVTGFSSYPVYSISPSFGFSTPITYNTDDMSYSGFSSDNFIKGNYIFEMTTAQFTKGFTLQVHIKTPSSFPSENMHLIYCGSDYTYGPYIGIRSGGQCAYCGLSSGGTQIFEISNTSTQLSANTEYWLRMTKPDTTYFAHDTVLQLSTDGETWTDLGSSSSAPSTTITADRWLRAGYAGKVFTGRLYLEDTFIEIDGERVWDMVEETTFSPAPTPTRVYNNFTTVGSPAINQSTGVVSGFGSSDYLKLPQIFNPSSNTWEVMFKVTMGTVGDGQWILGSGIWGTDFQGFALGLERDKPCFYLSETGSSWDLASYVEGTTTCYANTTYYFKLQFTGTEYILSLSTDGINWNTEATVQSSTPIYVSQSPLAIGSNLWNNEENTTYWKGSIDLSESYIKINGSTWWVGYTES